MSGASSRVDGAGEASALDPTEIDDVWPVPSQPVWGSRGGFLAAAEAKLVVFLLAVVARLPNAAFDAMVGTLARLAKLVDRRHTRAARGFLTQALGEMPKPELERRVLQAYRHFFRVLAIPGRLARRVPPERMLEQFDVHWTDDARRVAESDGGCVMLTAHIGNWEESAFAVQRLGFAPVYAVAKPLRNRPLSKLAQSTREARGIRLLPRRGAMNDAPKVIRAGGLVGMLLDQRARKRPVLAPFFGRPARCDRSAGVLMKRMRAPVLILACTLTDDPLRFRLEFYDCIWPDEVKGADPVAIATRVNRAFERMILDYPDQYFWLHDRYKNTPLEFTDEDEDASDSTLDPHPTESNAERDAPDAPTPPNAPTAPNERRANR